MCVCVCLCDRETAAQTQNTDHNTTNPLPALDLPNATTRLGEEQEVHTHVLDHIRCELIAKRVSGETPGGIFTKPEENKQTVLFLKEKSESEQWKEEKGASRPASTKSLPQCVCSILSNK